jgi:hypothetical protein
MKIDRHSMQKPLPFGSWGTTSVTPTVFSSQKSSELFDKFFGQSFWSLHIKECGHPATAHREGAGMAGVQNPQQVVQVRKEGEFGRVKISDIDRDERKTTLFSAARETISIVRGFLVSREIDRSANTNARDTSGTDGCPLSDAFARHQSTPSPLSISPSLLLTFISVPL